MASPLKIGYRCRLEVARVAGVSSIMALLVFLPASLWAQAMGTGSNNSTNRTSPTQLPGVPDLKLPGHDGYVITPSPLGEAAPSETIESLGQPAKKSVAEECASPWWQYWEFSLTTLYEFSSERSKVGGVSLDRNSGTIDLSGRRNVCPYTSIDISYTYSHATGSSTSGANEIVNQHVGFIRTLQPLNEMWNHDWEPADLHNDRSNHQLSIILGAAYGGSPSSLSVPNAAFVHTTGHSLFGEALLDYQFAWFPDRPDRSAHDYPSLLAEIGAGAQFETDRVDVSSASTRTSSARQFDYVGIGSLTYSFSCRFGFQVGIEWDAPLVSDSLSGGRPDHASTVTFTGGLVYNIYPRTLLEDKARHLSDLSRWSVSLLYSYTAFDPLTETNRLLLQISCAF